MTLFVELTLASILLMTAAFFSASETALVSLSPQKAKRLGLRNPKATQALLGWLDKPHELLIVILVGNTLTIVMLATLITTMALRYFHAYPAGAVEITTWFIQTGIILILAETAPKFFARAQAEKTSLFVLPWLSRLRTLFRPILFLFPHRKNSSPVGKVLTFSMDELKGLMEEDELLHAGSPTESQTMMQRVLEIYGRRAESIMTPLAKIDSINIDHTDRELLMDLIIEHGHTRTPVESKGKFIGYIHSDDLLPFIVNDPKKPLVKYLRTPMNFSADQPVSELLQQFKTSGIHTGFVRNKKKEIIGLVTMEDVLEEITGEILDEHDIAYKNRGPFS